MSGKKNPKPNVVMLSKPQLIAKLRTLGYAVDQQAETVSTLMATVAAQADLIVDMQARLLLLETRQPTSFRRA